MKQQIPFLSGILAVVSITGYFLWQAEMTRTATIKLENSDLELTYSVHWNWGMQERFSLSKSGAVLGRISSDWIKILDKPYNSGLTVYQSIDDRTYYLGFGPLYRLYKYDIASRKLDSSCNPETAPAPTKLGEAISKVQYPRPEVDVPGASVFFRYLNAAREPKFSSLPPTSRYYANLRYLGRFGLTQGGHRGRDVIFVSADQLSEPSMGLNFSCG